VPEATHSRHTYSPTPCNDLNFFDSAHQCLMVRRWRLIGHFPILYNPLQRHHKRCKQKIEKDELRVGREIDNGDYLMTLWHHLGCWGDMDKGFGSALATWRSSRVWTPPIRTKCGKLWTSR
jgi:hypothetical protein